jgi:hypothetical protein
MGIEGRLVAEQRLSVDVAVAAYEAALHRAIEQS